MTTKTIPNDLAKTHPELIAEWNYPDNDNVENVTGKDSVWWRCNDKGHEWTAKVKTQD